MRAYVKLALASMFLTSALVAQEAKLATKAVPVFTVVGLKIRTNTARELGDKGAIPGIWRQLLEEKLIEQIPNRAGDEMIAIYTDYENGKKGMYSYVLGAKVTAVGKIPTGMVAQEAGGGTYAILTSEGELLGDMIVDAWKQIWARENLHEIERVYSNDFEIHYAGPPDDKKHRAMDLFVGVKPGK